MRKSTVQTRSWGGGADAQEVPRGSFGRALVLQRKRLFPMFAIVCFLAVTLSPAVYLVSVSLMDNGQFLRGSVIAWPFHISNFGDAWERAGIGRLYLNSAFVSVTAALATLLLCIPASYALARLRFFGQGPLFAFFLLGLTLPASTALIPIFFNLKALGLLNTPWALIGPYTAFGLSFGTFVMKGFFEQLPVELEEAARIDGAGEARVFAQIMLPLTRPAIATVSIFLFLANWNEFIFALTFISDPARRTLPTGIYALIDSEFYGNYPTLAAALVIFALPVLVLYFVFQRQFIEALTAGAVKQ